MRRAHHRVSTKPSVPALTGLLALLLLAGPLSAGEWRLRPELLTEVPVQAGAGVVVEGPWRLRAATSLGWLPRPYLQATNEALVAWFGDSGYSRETADLVEEALRGSLVWTVSAGWRPWARHGFYFHLGYRLLALGGGLSPATLLEALGSPLVTDAEGRHSYSVESTLHQADLQVGWEWGFRNGLTLRAALGAFFTLGSSSSVQADFTPRPLFAKSVQKVEQFGEDYLNDTYQTYIHAPYLALALGYRF